MSRRFATGHVPATLLLLCALLLVLHAPVFTRGALITPAGMHYAQWPWKAYAGEAVARGAMLQQNHVLSDLLFQVYPWQHHIVRSWQDSSVPLWNPYSYCGVPFVANAQSAVFYPLHWPAWLIPSMRVFTIALLLKILLAGGFMALFLRGLGISLAPCLVGSVSFALCSFMTNWLGYAHTSAAIFLPLLMHAARALALTPGHGPFLLLAAASGAQYLGGHPETSLHIVGAAFLYFLWNLRESKRPWLAGGLSAAGAALGLTLAAVQLIPFVEYLMKSAALQRRQAFPAVDPTLPAGAILGLLVPSRFGRPWDFTYPEALPAFQAMVGYAGAGVVLLALISLFYRRQRAKLVFFLAAALVSGLVIYGPAAVRDGIRWIPLLGISSNNRLLLMLCFCLATLAAAGLDEILARRADARAPASLVRAGTLILLAVLLGAASLWGRGDDPFGGRLAAGVIGGTGLLAALSLLRPQRRTVYLSGIVGVTCLDMLLFAYRFNPHADPAELFRSTRLTRFVESQVAAAPAAGGRMMTVGWAMRPETQMPYGLASIEGYDAMELAPYRRLLERAKVAEIHDTGMIPDDARPLLDLIGLRYLVTPPDVMVAGPEIALGYDGPDGRVFINHRARPRLSFVPRAAMARADPLETIVSAAFHPDREILIEGDGSEGSRPEDSSSPSVPRIEVHRDKPGDLDLTLSGHHGGYLAFTEAHDEGWRAFVNGEPADVLRANYCFMAVALPEGSSRVRLVYAPLSFRAGAVISVLSLPACALVALLLRRSRLNSGCPPDSLPRP